MRKDITLYIFMTHAYLIMRELFSFFQKAGHLSNWELVLL